MNETLEHIDKYFNGQLSESEKAAFEKQCESDQSFAEEIAFYISARAASKEELYKQKKKEFQDQYVQLSSSEKGRKQSGIIQQIVQYAAVAAACLLIFLGLQFFFKAPPAKQLADNYIEKNMQVLSVSMGNSKDSLQSGIAAFNNKNYKEAERIFQALATQPENGSEAIKNLGTIYLVTADYNKALEQFDLLANQKNLYANPGLFYKALTLMKRGDTGDKEKAKRLLKEVVQKDLPGRNEAEIWIQKL